MGSSSGLPTIPSLPSFAPPGGYSNANGGNGGLGGSGLGGGGLSFYNPGPPNNYGSNFSYNSGFYGGAPGSPLSSMGLQPYPAASQGLPPPPSFSSPSFEQPMQLSRRDSFGSGAGGPPGGRRGSVSGSGRSRMISGGPGSPGSSMGGMGGGLGPAGFAGLGTSDIPPYPTTAGNDAPLFGTGPLAPTTPNLNRPSGSGAPGSSRGTPVVSPSLPSSANMGGSAKASPQIGSTSAAGQAPGVSLHGQCGCGDQTLTSWSAERRQSAREDDASVPQEDASRSLRGLRHRHYSRVEKRPFRVANAVSLADNCTFPVQL